MHMRVHVRNTIIWVLPIRWPRITLLWQYQSLPKFPAIKVVWASLRRSSIKRPRRANRFTFWWVKIGRHWFRYNEIAEMHAYVPDIYIRHLCIGYFNLKVAKEIRLIKLFCLKSMLICLSETNLYWTLLCSYGLVASGKAIMCAEFIWV